MQPRRKQPSLTIRSARATERLKLLTRNGRSQVSVIEEALDRMPLPEPDEEQKAKRWAELDALIKRIPKGSIMSIKEFDALEYDENGDLR